MRCSSHHSTVQSVTNARPDAPRDNVGMSALTPSPPRRPAPGTPLRAEAKPFSAAEIDQLQALLDAVPQPLEPLDVSMLDGYLCGVLLQPKAVPAAQWLTYVTDADGRALPPRFNPAPLHAMALRRHAELNAAIAQRQWFDPWVFELDDESADHARHHATDPVDVDDEGEDEDEEVDDNRDSPEPPAIGAVYPWVAGFAAAQEYFGGLMALDVGGLTEPLALLYRHLAPDDLEDADDLLAEIETLMPPADLSEAVEELVRAVLLLADVSRPQHGLAKGAAPGRPAPHRNASPGGPARGPAHGSRGSRGPRGSNR